MATKWQTCIYRSKPGFQRCKWQQVAGEPKCRRRIERDMGPDAQRLGGLASLIDDFVGAGYQRRWHGEPERFCCLEVDREFEFGRLQEWQIGWLRALKNPTDTDTGLIVLIGYAGAIADQAA